jgi:hypothetical protein
VSPAEIKEIREALARIEGALTQLATVILGPEGNEGTGLCQRVERVERTQGRIIGALIGLVFLLAGLGVIAGADALALGR